MDDPDDMTPRPRRRLSRGIYLELGVLAVLVALVVPTILLAAQRQVAAERALVTLGITSDPEGADVIVDDLVVGRTPLRVRLERGEPVQEVGLSARAELSVHERAGEFLARLHALPIAADDPLTLDEAFRMRVEAWSARADGLLPERVIRNAVALAHEALPALAVMTRVACHRDFTPRNWLIDEAGTLTVIDFEHSRPDLHLVDFERLFTGLWRSRPELREAFLSGYGTDLSGDRTVVLRGVAALGGLSTVVWAREHGDARFEEHGRDVLSWLGLS